MQIRLNDVIDIMRKADIKPEIIAILKPDTSLMEAGVDSMDIANVLFTIEDQYNIKIPDEETMELDSINLLIKLVNKKLKYSPIIAEAN